ncbi:Retrovirus-related Pol polyprotein [Arachis hypogaea]|nr:Retrovirus-related Pol polyprotein [Arachis hypogaea]
MNLIIWNYRGTRGKTFISFIKHMKKEYHVSFLILLKTHISRDRGRSIWENLGFDASFIKEARGYSSGIWCLWDPSIWKVDIIFHNHQLVHMMVTNGVSTP